MELPLQQEMREVPRSSKRRKLSYDHVQHIDTDVVETLPFTNGSLMSVLEAHDEDELQDARTIEYTTPPVHKEISGVITDHSILQKNLGTTIRKTTVVHSREPGNGGQDDVELPAPRSSGRQRRRPRRYSPDTIAVKGRSSAEKLSRATKDTSPGTDDLVSGQTTPSRVAEQKPPIKRVSKQNALPSPSTTLRKRAQQRAETASEGKQILSTVDPGTDADNNLSTKQPETLQAKPTLEDDVVQTHASSLVLKPISPNAPRQLSNATRPHLQHQYNVAVPSDSAGLELLKAITLNKLTGRRPIPLVGLEEERSRVHHLLEQTVAAGEGNSMLIIGARGTGKTALVKSVLQDLAKEYGDQFHVIRLNGFIHTDDKLALREIWRQLGREMEVEEESQAKNYADTLSTLLALLSHPAELPGADVGQAQVAKSVIFVMEEFDTFASHPRQTLLYNLFDVAQSRQAPVAVLGLTTRIDVAESLEKRVKSRFSQRYVHLSLPKSLPAFVEICKTALHIDPEELNFDERVQLIQCMPRAHEPCPVEVTGSSNEGMLAAWNSSVETLFKSDIVTNHLSRIYHTTKSIPEALTSFFLPVSLLAPSNPLLSPTSFATAPPLHPPDSKLHLLPSIPTLGLALLIAAARLDIILDTDTCNFNMAYDEYSRMAAKARVSATTSAAGVGIGGRMASKEVARGVWEKLVELELLLPLVGAGGVGMASGSEMVRCDVALEEIEPAVPDMERGLEKWCREL